MSCLRPSMHEPEFETVTSDSDPHSEQASNPAILHPISQRQHLLHCQMPTAATTAASTTPTVGTGQGIGTYAVQHQAQHSTLTGTTPSTPQLRLLFDDQDRLMTDAEFEDIINRDQTHGISMTGARHAGVLGCDVVREGEIVRPPTPLLPPSPFYRTRDNNWIMRDRAGVRRRAIDDLEDEYIERVDPRLLVPNDLREQLSHLELGSTDNGEGDATGASNSTRSGSFDKGKGKAEAVEMTKVRPRPISIVPRLGTLTALPGSKMTDNDDFSPETGTNAPSRGAPAGTSSMPPPPPPQPATPSRKRKLSLSAPFSTIKRIMTSSGGKPKPTITHLTHEATASNRNLEDVGAGVTGRRGGSTRSHNPHTTTKGRDLITPTFAGPSSAYADHPSPVSTRNPTPTPSSTRSIANVLFRPLHRRTNTLPSTTGTGTGTGTDTDGIKKKHKHNSTLESFTSKSALNKLIVQLRGKVSDLTLENTVLKDQIAIVRKDWIDTSQELDLERHRAWEWEMANFKLKLRMEEMRSELARLRRGSYWE